ncbi:MAG TPA: GNAT family N-acetyltransferase [Candidatus Latescibacteria bacterium]|nr:GNAT family N-acetyltransferase [Candidatus Latescibacterota bacterium]
MVVELRELSRGGWDGYLERLPGATPFHTRDWLECLEEARNARWIPLGIFQGGELVGLFPTFQVRKHGIRFWASPLAGWATSYLGPLCPPNVLKEALRAFLKLGRDQGADYAEVLFHPGVALEAFPQVALRRTYILPLDGGRDSVWKGLKRECRNRVRKALKEGVWVEEVKDPGFIDVYWEMAEQMYSGLRRLPPIPKDVFRWLWERLYPKGRLKLLAAEHLGRPVAAAFFLLYRDTAYFWDGVSKRETHPLAPNNLLHWTLIEQAVAEGFRRYDMLGANIPGVARFKATFGPHLVLYGSLSLPLTFKGRVEKDLRRWMPLVQRFRYTLRRSTPCS